MHYWKGKKILEIFGDNTLKFVEQWKIINISRNIFIGKSKFRNMGANLSAFGPKMNKNLKSFQKILRFVDQNIYGKLTFFTFFTKYFSDFWLLSESIYHCKIKPNVSNNFSDFLGGGERSGVPTLPTLQDCLWKMIFSWKLFLGLSKIFLRIPKKKLFIIKTHWSFKMNILYKIQFRAIICKQVEITNTMAFERVSKTHDKTVCNT